MSLYLDIWRLGWPLFVGFACLLPLALELRAQVHAARHSLPPEIARAQTMFAQGEVLRALVMVEGLDHPLIRRFSRFWKGIEKPRAREGLQLIADYQALRPALINELRGLQGRFISVFWAALLLQVAWILLTAPEVFLLPPLEALALGPIAGVLWFGLGLTLFALPLQARSGRAIRTLIDQLDHQVYEAITGLAQSRGEFTPSAEALRHFAPADGGDTPPHFAARAYKG